VWGARLVEKMKRLPELAPGPFRSAADFSNPDVMRESTFAKQMRLAMAGGPGPEPSGPGVGTGDGIERLEDYLPLRITWTVRAMHMKPQLHSDYTVDIPKGALVFVRTQLTLTAQYNRRRREGDERYNSIMDKGVYQISVAVPVLNMMLHQMALQVGAAPVPDPDSVLRDWRLGGALSTDAAEAKYLTGNRFLVLDTQNVIDIRNVWSTDVCTNDELWMLIKAVPAKAQRTYFPHSSSPETVTLTNVSAKGDTYVPWVVQLVPFVSSTKYVKSKHLLACIVDPDMSESYVQGHAVRVGKVAAPMASKFRADASGAYLNGGPLNLAAACWDARALRNVPSLDVRVNVF
jgi:hypothetical protein